MYESANKAMEELVISQYNEAAWTCVKKRSGVLVDYLLCNESYNDEAPFQQVHAVSEEGGLLPGLGKSYKPPVKISQLESSANRSDHDVFNVNG